VHTAIPLIISLFLACAALANYQAALAASDAVFGAQVQALKAALGGTAGVAAADEGGGGGGGLSAASVASAGDGTSSVPTGSLRGSGATTPLAATATAAAGFVHQPTRPTVASATVHPVPTGATGHWDGSTAAPTLEETRRYLAAARAARPPPLTHAQAVQRVRDETIAAGGVMAVPVALGL